VFFDNLTGASARSRPSLHPSAQPESGERMHPIAKAMGKVPNREARQGERTGLKRDADAAVQAQNRIATTGTAALTPMLSRFCA
jgi:hypothetical protein